MEVQLVNQIDNLIDHHTESDYGNSSSTPLPSPTEGRARAFLVVKSVADAGKTISAQFELTAEAAILGRNQKVHDIYLPTTSLSRTPQAIFCFEGGIVECQRMGKLWINGARATSNVYHLVDGDTVAVVNKRNKFLKEPFWWFEVAISDVEYDFLANATTIGSVTEQVSTTDESQTTDHSDLDRESSEATANQPTTNESQSVENAAFRPSKRTLRSPTTHQRPLLQLSPSRCRDTIRGKAGHLTLAQWKDKNFPPCPECGAPVTHMNGMNSHISTVHVAGLFKAPKTLIIFSTYVMEIMKKCPLCLYYLDPCCYEHFNTAHTIEETLPVQDEHLAASLFLATRAEINPTYYLVAPAQIIINQLIKPNGYETFVVAMKKKQLIDEKNWYSGNDLSMNEKKICMAINQYTSLASVFICNLDLLHTWENIKRANKDLFRKQFPKLHTRFCIFAKGEDVAEILIPVKEYVSGVWNRELAP